MTQYARICYQLGGDVSQRWARQDTLSVTERGAVLFDDVETGCRKRVSATVPHVLTEDVELPPTVVPWDTEDQTDA